MNTTRLFLNRCCGGNGANIFTASLVSYRLIVFIFVGI